jgi:hypothetical protein
MAGVAFELPEPLITPVHKLRRTYEGVQHLKQTGRFKEYMQDFVDSKNRPFIAWDGEGWTDTNGEHRYMLLQNSYGENISAPQLSTDECLDFMLRAAVDHPKHIHIIFGGGYDVTHILRDMPEERRLELKETGSTRYFAKRNGRIVNRYTMQYIPHKWFMVTGWSWELKRNVSFKIFDVMTFFQSSFMNALDSRGIEVPEVIKTGKANRPNFTYLDLDEISAYCQQELEMLVQLANQLRSEFQEAGVYVTSFHGPGAVASSVFKEKKVKEHMQRPPLHIEQAAQRAYFGGRFEQFKAGHYEGKVYVYDINSAYPDKIRNLPSMAGSSWEYTTVFDSSPGLWFCSHDGTDASGIAPQPTPWRGKGGVVGFPEQNTGVWLWHFEAVHASTVHHGWKLITATDAKPFDFVEKMYCQRQAWKQLGLGAERALKLALNSLYGKMAQRVGGNEKNGGVPPWHQIEWAGMVTSATRAQIWEAVSQAPESIIAIETDSVASTVPLNLDIGSGLGQWEVKIYDWITYVQSGIYFTPDYYHDENGKRHGATGKSGEKVKSRGIDVTQLHHSHVLDYMRGDRTELLVTTRQFIGLTNPATWNYGQWQDSTKEVKIAGAKRVHMKANCEACLMGLPMDKFAHDLTANPIYGYTESIKHPLPWLDSETLDDPEMRKLESEAVSAWETSERHIPQGHDTSTDNLPTALMNGVQVPIPF